MKRFLLLLIFPALIFQSCSEKKTGMVAPVLENGKWGYVDESGNYLIDPKFEFADIFYNGNSIVKLEGKFGVIDLDGNMLSSGYDTLIRISPDNFFAKKNSLYGVADKNGKFSVEPQFTNIAPYQFSDSLYQGLLPNEKFCVVSARGKLIPTGQLLACDAFEKGLAPFATESMDDDSVAKQMKVFGRTPAKSGLIDRKGNIVVPADKYDHIIFSKRAGCFISYKVRYVTDVDMFGNFGLIDTTGKVIAEPVYEDEPVYGDGLYLVRSKGKYGYIDKNGKMVIEPQFDFAIAFGEGFAIAGTTGKPSIIDKTGKQVASVPFVSGAFPFKNGYAGFVGTERKKIGFIDQKGNIIASAQYDIATDFEDGCAVVQKDSLLGMIDKSGKEILPISYRHVERLKKNIYQVVTVEGKIGLADEKGKLVIQPFNDDVFAFDDATVSVVAAGRYGAYTNEGKLIYPAKSKKPLFFFERNYAVADDNGLCGLVDRSGKILLPMENDSIGYFMKGYAPLVKGGKSGIVDSTGKIILAPKYDELLIAPNGYARIRENGKFGFADLKGNIVCEPRFDDAGPLTDPNKKY